MDYTTTVTLTLDGMSITLPVSYRVISESVASPVFITGFSDQALGQSSVVQTALLYSSVLFGLLSVLLLVFIFARARV